MGKRALRIGPQKQRSAAKVARELVLEFYADSWVSPGPALARIAEKYIAAERRFYEKLLKEGKTNG